MGKGGPCRAFTAALRRHAVLRRLDEPAPRCSSRALCRSRAGTQGCPAAAGGERGGSVPPEHGTSSALTLLKALSGFSSLKKARAILWPRDGWDECARVRWQGTTGGQCSGMEEAVEGDGSREGGSVLPSTPGGFPGETAGHRSCSHHPELPCPAPSTLQCTGCGAPEPGSQKGMGGSSLLITGDVTAVPQLAGRGPGRCLVPGGPGAFSGSDPERPNAGCASLAPVSSPPPLRFAATAASKQTERRFQSRQQ